jgi:predicted double-glycine peptidase
MKKNQANSQWQRRVKDIISKIVEVEKSLKAMDELIAYHQPFSQTQQP